MAYKPPLDIFHQVRKLLENSRKNICPKGRESIQKRMLHTFDGPPTPTDQGTCCFESKLSIEDGS